MGETSSTLLLLHTNTTHHHRAGATQKANCLKVVVRMCLHLTVVVAHSSYYHPSCNPKNNIRWPHEYY
jgi:hypothetical protein